jgi:hypothetical protein
LRRRFAPTEMQMSISAIGSGTPVATSTPVGALDARAANGDYKKPGPLTSQVKDSDGDYKPSSASAAGSSSNAVLSALNSLKTGG